MFVLYIKCSSLLLRLNAVKFYWFYLYYLVYIKEDGVLRRLYTVLYSYYAGRSYNMSKMSVTMSKNRINLGERY